MEYLMNDIDDDKERRLSLEWEGQPFVMGYANDIDCDVVRRLPAEWEEQSFVQITWPNEDTDWSDVLDEAIECYKNIVATITKYEPMVIVARDRGEVERHLTKEQLGRVTIVEAPINDTWARDHGFITVEEDGVPVLLDFQFNGWGLKFASDKDNMINRYLYKALFEGRGYRYENHLGFTLEGGSIESNGEGMLLTTEECLSSPNRNGDMTQSDISESLDAFFELESIRWLGSGYLAGDDTDSHIDTLARLAPDNTVLYVKCDDETDEHYEALKAMEDELKAMRTKDDEPFNLVALPMCSAVYDPENGERLPATYANFLYVNGAVIVPTYNVPEDTTAVEIFRATFPDRKIETVDCSVLIRQHGSLHCVTMQFPKSVKL